MSVQWSLVLFTALTGTAGWGFAALAFSEFRGKVARENQFFAAIVLLIVLIVGGCASVTHLSHVEGILGALQHPTSGIFVEAVLVGLTALPAVIYLILIKQNSSANALRVFAVLAAVFGVVLSFMAGESYMMAARPSWNTILLPMGYTGTALPAGIALYMLLIGIKGEEIAAELPVVLGIGGIIAAVSAAAYGIVSGDTSHVLILWLLCVLVGGAAPAAIGFAMKKKQEQIKNLTTIALACSIIGVIAYRCFMWMCATDIVNFFSMTI